MNKNRPMIECSHIGNLIINFLKNKNLPQAYLAKELNMPTSNLSRLLKRESMDTDKLLDISIKLKHNFFADICGDEINGENLSLILVPVGRQIENRLKELKITQSKFAALLDVTPAEISRLLKKTSFDVLKLLKISSILDYNFLQDFYESNLEENKGIIKRYEELVIENNRLKDELKASRAKIKEFEEDFNFSIDNFLNNNDTFIKIDHDIPKDLYEKLKIIAKHYNMDENTLISLVLDLGMDMYLDKHDKNDNSK